MKLKPKFTIVFVPLVVAVVIIVRFACAGTLITEGIDEYFYNGFFQNHKDDITTGRMDRNIGAIEVITQSPMWGRLTYDYTLRQVHNYILRVLSDYGILGSIAIISIYLCTLASIAKLILKRGSVIKNIGPVILLVPFWTSLAEPTFPFGPGTVVFMAYVFMGVALADNDAFHREEETDIATIRVNGGDASAAH